MRNYLPLFSLLLLALGACRPTPVPETAQSDASIPATSAADASGAVPMGSVEAFTDRVWRVDRSSAVALGTRYTFLGDGTLVITSTHGTPTQGLWHYRDGALTLVEEGISYPTDILQLDDTSFVIRSNSPAGPVTIALVAAPGEPLPAVGVDE